jgi:hypothetical protein
MEEWLAGFACNVIIATAALVYIFAMPSIC